MQMSAFHRLAMLTIKNTKQIFEFRTQTMQNSGSSEQRKLRKKKWEVGKEQSHLLFTHKFFLFVNSTVFPCVFVQTT